MFKSDLSKDDLEYLAMRKELETQAARAFVRQVVIVNYRSYTPLREQMIIRKLSDTFGVEEETIRLRWYKTGIPDFFLEDVLTYCRINGLKMWRHSFRPPDEIVMMCLERKKYQKASTKKSREAA